MEETKKPKSKTTTHPPKFDITVMLYPIIILVLLVFLLFFISM